MNTSKLVEKHSFIQLNIIKLGKLILLINLLTLSWAIEIDDLVLVKTFNQHNGDVFDVEITQNQKHFVSISDNGAIRIWDLKKRKLIKTIKNAHGEWGYRLAISENSKWFASAGCDEISNKASNVINIKKKAEKCRKAKIKVWALPTGKLIRELEGHFSAIWALSFLNQSRYLVSGGQDDKLILWDLKYGLEIKTYRNLSSFTLALKKVPNNPYFISGGKGAQLKFWDFKKNTPFKILRMNQKVVWSLDVNERNYSIAFAGKGPHISLYNLARKSSSKIANAHKVNILALNFSKNGRFLASAGCDHLLSKTNICQKSLIKIWGGWKRSKSPKTHEDIRLLKTTPGHGKWSANEYFDRSPSIINGVDGIWDLEFTSNNRYLISAGRDKLIKIWDLKILDTLQSLNLTNRKVVKKVYQNHQDDFSKGIAHFYRSPLMNNYQSPIFKQLFLPIPTNLANEDIEKAKKKFLTYRDSMLSNYLSLSDLTIPRRIKKKEIFDYYNTTDKLNSTKNPSPLISENKIQEEVYSLKTLASIGIDITNYILIKKYNNIALDRANKLKQMKRYFTIEAFKQMMKSFEVKYPRYNKENLELQMDLIASGINYSERVVFKVKGETHARIISKNLENLKLEVTYQIIRHQDKPISIVVKDLILDNTLEGRPLTDGFTLADY